jgi:LPS-assembly lipoprotein
MKRLLPFAAAAALSVALAGCGFTPLYGTGGVSPALSSIEVRTPETRTGHLLREELYDAFARNKGRAPAYLLSIAMNEDRYARGLRIDDVATRYEVALRVEYILTDARTRRQLKTGAVNANVTYDATDQPYSSVAAFADGQERAATQAAERIRLDLARFFALSPRPTSTEPPPPGVPDPTPESGGR